MAITPITNLRGPAARIVEATAEPAAYGAGTEVVMTGPDQGRKFHFKVERGIPGVNAVENDTAVATYLGATDTESRAALDEILLTETVPLSIMKPVPAPPVGFRGLSVLPMPTVRRSVGRFTVEEREFDVLKPTGGGIFYTAPGAPPSGDGLTAATPKQLLACTRDLPSGSTIILADGEYSRVESAISGGVIAKSLLIRAGGNYRPKITGFEPVSALTWTLEAGSIYKATRSGTVAVLDIVNLTGGIYTKYTKRNTLAEIAGPGEWAVSGSTVYVWAIGGTNLATGSAQIRLQISANAGVIASGAGNVIWVEGIDFIACAANATTFRGGIMAVGGGIVVNKDCKVLHNLGMDGPATRDGGHMISIRCEVAWNELDGFNYHNTLSGGLGEFIEIDCYSHDNGLTAGASTNNASTAHEATTGIRVGGVYDRSSGPVVADVNSAHSWNLGCHAGGQAQVVAAGQDQSWRTDGSAQIAGKGAAKMWLDECTSDGAPYAIRTSTDSEIEIHAFGYSNPNGAWTGSLVANYTR